MTAPQSHITGRVRAEARRYEGHVPPGWSREAWAVYLNDPDGGRAPYRQPEPTPSELFWGDDLD